MKIFDVLSKVSEIPENEVSGIYEKVKKNQEILGSCNRHDFSIDTVPHTKINKTWECTHCGGKVNSSAKMWYELGLVHRKDYSSPPIDTITLWCFNRVTG